MKVYARSDIGLLRPINEDSFYVPQGDEVFCAVADGMGGHNAGEVASQLAVKTFAEKMRTGLGDAYSIRRAVRFANEAVFSEACKDAGKYGMGTTFTALCVKEGTAYIAHVGDSRAYRIRDGHIDRVTNDHSLVEEMVRSGLITPEEARVHPKRNYITRALGTGWALEIDLYPQVLRPGDVFLMCTDGLSGQVTDEEMLAVTLMEGTWEARLDALIDKALKNGGPDNITAMYVTFEEDAQ
ncbi:MAG: Stp1/IreP family PP2C-type Ser/Thr phosphatase [Clostridiales bacterium]|nr:Stp1/IreP family PP2C-type Ser/Thr phosphatase [Clostridiales bacterium]